MDESVEREWRRRAKGYVSREVTSEFTPDENGRLVETKRKIVRRRVPGDPAALKWLEENGEARAETLSDEELAREKRRYLQLLAALSGEEEV